MALCGLVFSVTIAYREGGGGSLDGCTALPWVGPRHGSTVEGQS